MSLGNIPSEFIERWEIFYGKSQTRVILSHLKYKDPRIIAANKIKIQLSELRFRLEKKGFNFSLASEFDSLIVRHEPYSIVSTPEYLSGQFSIQSLTSLIPPRCLKPSSKSIVADLTASPGIKTCLLAQEMKNDGTILAIEKSKNRIPALRANLTRLGIWNTIVLNFNALLFPKLRINVDNILLDAPCSGTGLKITKDKRLLPKSLEDVFRHADLQQALLESAWQQLKPNGTLVYSTCSLEPEEGEVQISNFLGKHSNEAILLPVPYIAGISGKDVNWKTPLHHQLKYSRRIFPDIGYDGFFVTCIKKVAVN
jgi:NOL1/NOP2/sun family putative RNA methylase